MGRIVLETFRKWEITTKKMADYRNHRRFMLRCIKASITPVSCKLKASPSFRSNKSYQIIHKAEKQLLYECIRNINGILAMLDKQRAEQYSKFKEILNNLTTNTAQNSLSDTSRDQVLNRARLLINKIKEHQHNKIKTKQQDKFEHLHYKRYGCHHNLTSHHHCFNHINRNSNSLSGQPNVPSSSSPRPSTPSITSSIPATPMAPTPSTSTITTQSTQANPTSNNPHNPNTCRDHMDKWVINLSRTPSTLTNYPYYKKGPNLAITPKYPPIDAYIMATELASSKLLPQEADEFRLDVNRLLKEEQQQHHNNCNLNPAQCRALTQLKQDNTRVVLTMDKGVAMVIMDQRDYNTKAQILLQDTNTYKVLPKDPTPTLKNKLINLLKDIKQSGGLSIQKYKQLYPTSAVPPKFYGLPKIHKTGTPSDP